MKLSEVFKQDCIVMNLESTDKGSIIRDMVGTLVDAGRFKATQKGNVVKAVLERESLGTTGIGEGVAIPHAKLKFVKKFFGALGIIDDGVDWMAADGAPVRFVFLFTSPDDMPKDHQALIKSIITFIRLPHFLKFLGNTKKSKDVADLFKEAESQV